MKSPRKIKNEEQRIVKFLLGNLKLPARQLDIPSQVVPLNDDQMGSISFDLMGDKKFGKDLIQGKYIDKDDVVVLITLTIDNNNELFELEFWKTDFNALIEYPLPEKIEITTTHIS